MKNTVKKYGWLSDFYFFYSYLGYKMFLAIFLSFSVGLLDGLGLAMFVPLLQMVGQSEDAKSDMQAEGVGNFEILLQMFEQFNIPFTLLTILLLILFFFSAKAIARFLESYYTIVLTTNLVRKIRYEAVNKISNINYGSFIKIDSGRVQNTLSGEIERLQQSYKYFAASVQSFIAILVYVSLAFLTNPQFAFLVAIGGSLSNLIYTQLYKKTKATSKNITVGNHTFHGLMMEQVNNFKYLKATGQIITFGKKLKSTIDNLANSFRKIGFYNSILIATKEPLAIGVVVVVIMIQTTYFEADLGPIILSLLFFYRSLNQVINYQNSRNNFLNYSGSLYNYQEFIEEIKQNQLHSQKSLSIERIKTIEMKNAYFSYDGKDFLKEINLTIRKNQTVAFVGKSGSGKTTLTNILTGLLFLDSGKLLINGTEIGDINLNQFQNRIGYITQDPVIFNDTLYNNVTFWSEKSPENMVKFRECLEMASLWDFFESIGGVEDVPLGNNGVLLSGGQKQRIAIAREIFKDIDLLVMDEATSALDTATELAIQESFERLKGKFTMIVIAHRLSTIKSADLIYVLKDGQISNFGSFYDLFENSLEFRRMVELQGVE
jgi:ABC-type multidrug transport system fused ATPase/permease subunit